MQELRQEAAVREKSKSKVGTKYSEKINYPKNLPAFDSSHIPARAKQIKSEIALSVLPDVLKAKPAKWNPSVLLDKSKELHEQVSSNQLYFEIRKGIRDVSNPLPSNPKLYEGVDSRNTFTGWNNSVLYSKKEHKENHLKTNQKARHNSAKRSREILSNKPYSNPFDRQLKIIEDSRVIKVQDSGLKSEIFEEIVHKNPDFSRAKTLAIVHKTVKDCKEKAKIEQFYGIQNESFKPDTKETGRQNLVKRCKHDGVFEYNQNFESTVWSCCLKEDKNCEGCVVTYKDKDKWQLVSI